jgi:hypothetical protein
MKDRLVLIQAVGFIALIALSWCDEWADLHSLILGSHPYISDFREATLEMLFVLAVWFVVSRCTARMLARMRRLEQFTYVCGWCRRVRFKGQWMPLEQFLLRGLDTTASHGICEECRHKETEAWLGDRRQMHLPGMISAPNMLRNRPE